MPELPEVETIRRDLEPYLCQSTVQVAWHNPESPVSKLLPNPDIAFSDREVWGLRRLGKVLMLEFAPWADSMGEGTTPEQKKSKPLLMAFSLGMTGQLFRTKIFPLQSVLEEYNHLHLVLRVEKQGYTNSFVVFRDPRKFGKIFASNWSEKRGYSHTRLQNLGVDATQITAEALKEVAGNSKRNIKTVLMDQSVVAGLGNIYTCEVLFRAGIYPKDRAKHLTVRHWEKLSQNIKAVIEEAIENRGSTISDYVSGDGSPGSFQKLHRVYGREGDECINKGCSERIHKITIAGRSTFFCPGCQRNYDAISREEERANP